MSGCRSEAGRQFQILGPATKWVVSKKMKFDWFLWYKKYNFIKKHCIDFDDIAFTQFSDVW